MPKILAGNVLAAGLRADFARTYDKVWDGANRLTGQCMSLGGPGISRTETFGYFESAPYPQHWEKGAAIPTEGLASVNYNVTHKKYGKRISWEIEDRQDEKLGKLGDRAQALGQNFASLPTRAMFDLMLSTTNLLLSTPNAPDGSALYLGSTRFGVSTGNIVTGTGVASAAAVRTDFFNAIELFGRFQDTKGEPLFDPSVTAGSYVLFYNVANSQVVNEAFVQGRTLASADTATSNGAVTNIIADSGITVQLAPTQRITDNDMYVFKVDSERLVMPFFEVIKEPITFGQATMENSDLTRSNGIEYVQWHTRRAYGINAAYTTVQINN